MELCRLLSKTPSEIGELRRERPMDIRFLEKRIIYELVEKDKQRKEYERKAKASAAKHRGRIGR